MSSSPPLVVADRYRLVAPLGQGGMGRVWRATDVVLHRDVAIKELVPPPGLTPAERQEMRERSLREARAIARLNNVNVVRVFDVLRTDADPWIVMEYVPSRSLQDTLAADGPFNPVRAAEIGLGVLGALRAAHRAGVVHRDVKPGNVLIGADGRVVLTDFGLATVPGDPNVTRTGLVLGSPAYIAPERARDGTAGPAADLWSLGATLYAAVEGASPFARPSAIATLAALATENPPPARNAGSMKPVLNGLLRKDPAHRISAEEAERLLLRATGRRSKLAFPMSPTMRRPGVGRERPALPGVTSPTGSSPVVPGPRPPVAPARPASPPASPAPGGRAAVGQSRPPVYVPGKAPVGSDTPARSDSPARSDRPTRVDGPKVESPRLDATRVDGPPAREDQNPGFGTRRGSATPAPAQSPAPDKGRTDPPQQGTGLARTRRGEAGSFTAADVAAARRKQAAPEHERSLAEATALIRKPEPEQPAPKPPADATTVLPPKAKPADATSVLPPARPRQAPADATSVLPPAQAKPADATSVLPPTKKAKPAEPKPTAPKPAATRPAEPEQSAAKPAEPEIAETKPAQTTPASTPSESKLAETTSAESKPAQTTADASKPTGSTSADSKLAEITSAESKSAAGASAESKLAETTSAESKSAADASAGSKLAETTAAESKLAETTAAESKSAETTAAESKSAETTAAESKAATATPGESKPAEATPADPKPAEADTKPAEATPAKSKPAKITPTASKSADTDEAASKPADIDTAKSKAADTEPDESKVAEPKPVAPADATSVLPPAQTKSADAGGPNRAKQRPADATSVLPPSTPAKKPAAKSTAPAGDRPQLGFPLARPAAKAKSNKPAKAYAPDEQLAMAGSVPGRPTARPAWRPEEVRSSPGITVFGTRLTYLQAAIGAGVLLVVLILLITLIVQAVGGGGDDKKTALTPGPVPTAQNQNKTPNAQSSKPSEPNPPSAQPSTPQSKAPALPAGWSLRTVGPSGGAPGLVLALPSNASLSNGDAGELRYRWNNRLLIVGRSSDPKADALADTKQQESSRRGSYRNYQLLGIRPVTWRNFESVADWEFLYTTDNGNDQHAIARNIRVDDKSAYTLKFYASPGDWTASQPDLKAIYDGFQPK